MVTPWDGSVMYQFWGHCVLDLVSRIIMSGAYLLYIFEVGNPRLGVWMYLWMVICRVRFWGHCDLDIVSRIILSGAYLLYHLR